MGVEDHLRRAGLAALTICVCAQAADPIRERLDIRYHRYHDANGVDDDLGALLFVKKLAGGFACQWEQTLDAVSGASRALGKDLRGEPRPGDYDAVTGASPIAETRHASRGAFVYAGHTVGGSLGFYYSREDDYVSAGPSLSLQREFFSGNFTLGAAASSNSDDFHPLGRFTGLGGRKRVRSADLSVAQSLTPLTQASAVFSWLAWDGYLGHPYLPPVAGDGTLLEENLPDRRRGAAAAAQIVQGYRLGYLLGSLSLSGKRYADDWGLRSAEGEIRWSQHLPGETLVRLRGRLYHQDGAAFANVPSADQRYRTADVRLFTFTSMLLGAKLAASFPDAWSEAWYLPDRWDIGYEGLIRDTRGDDLASIQPGAPTNGDPARPRLYQLYGSDEYYRQGTWAFGMGFDY